MESYNFQRQYTSFPKWNSPVSPSMHYINMVKFPLPWLSCHEALRKESSSFFFLPPLWNMEAAATSSSTPCLTGNCKWTGPEEKWGWESSNHVHPWEEVCSGLASLSQSQGQFLEEDGLLSSVRFSPLHPYHC